MQLISLHILRYPCPGTFSGTAEVVAYATGVWAVPLAAANLTLNAGALYKTYRDEGFSTKLGVQIGLATVGPVAGWYRGAKAGLMLGGASTRVGLIYNNLRQ